MMIAHIKIFFRNLSFQRKIITISIISGIFPLLLLTFFSLYNLYSLLSTQEQANTEDNLTAATQQLNSRIQSYEAALAYLTNNDLLIDKLNIENPTNFEQYDLYTNNIVPLFRSVALQHGAIQQITLFTTIDLYNHGNYVKHIESNDLTSHFMLNNTTKISYYFDADKELVYIYNQIYATRHQDTNVIVFEVSPRALFAGLNKISSEPYQLAVTTKEESLFSFNNEKSTLDLSFLARLINFFNPSYLTSKSPLVNGWQVTMMRPNYSIYYGVVLQGSIGILIFILAVGLLSLAIVGLSKTIVSPIRQLASQMRNPVEETLVQATRYDANDEIGSLYHSFDEMISQINKLIDDVYLAEINQQKFELRALQAQINPHFFYNSLALINNKAIIVGQDDIGEMARLLSTFYRLSLNNGESRLKVRKEIELTTTYAQIQLKMHNYSFDLEVDVDDRILDFEIITLLIQPFVENAIFHGIDHLEGDRRGQLMIKGTGTRDHLIFEIIDNGAGMTAEQISTILQHHSSHYGIRNVHQRIVLYYGVEDAISYRSKIGKGTTVKITLPKKPVQQSR